MLFFLGKGFQAVDQPDGHDPSAMDTCRIGGLKALQHESRLSACSPSNMPPRPDVSNPSP